MEVLNWRAIASRASALSGVTCLSAMLAIASWSVPCSAAQNADLAKLYQLQAAFHREGSVHDPVNGDSPEVIDQRVRDVVALWTADGSWTLQAGNPFDGTYTGAGDPEDPSTCPTPSADLSNRGTLCTFFKFVAGSYQPANKLVSLAPAYLTKFTIHGKAATVSFQCHFFNVATDPATGKPLWTAAGHSAFDGTAEKNQGDWHFSHVTITVAGIPIP
jgi:hypothetical protein